jgi:hypothetical protein
VTLRGTSGRPSGEVAVSWSVQVEDVGAVVVAAPAATRGSSPRIRADDRRLERLVGRSLDDLHALRMATPARPDEVFLAAGAPGISRSSGATAWAAG